MSAPAGDGNDRGVRIVGGEPPEGVELVGFLGRGRLGETWLVRTPRDPVAVGKRLRSPGAADSVEALRRLADVHDPTLLAVRGVELRDRGVWVLGEHCEGVTLRRLGAVASLTTAQWLVIARSVLLGLDALHRGGLVHGALHAGNVHVGVDGRVRTGDGGIAIPQPPPAELERLQGDDLTAAWTLLRGVAGPGVRRPGWPAALTALFAEPRLAARPAIAVLAAVEAAEPGAAEAASRARAQLAALVVPLLRRPDAPAAPALPAALPATPAAPPPVPPPPPVVALASAPGPWRARRSRRALAAAGGAAALALAGAATVLGIGLLGHRSGPASAERPHHPHPATRTAPASTAPSPPLPALAPFGPPSAGDVTAVSVQPLDGSCTPGTPCTVAVRIDLGAHASETVGWVLEIVDRCTGARTEVDVPDVPAPPSFVFVYSSTTVTLPATASAAIVALTTAPAQAASVPLLVSAGTGDCAQPAPPAALVPHR